MSYQQVREEVKVIGSAISHLAAVVCLKREASVAGHIT